MVILFGFFYDDGFVSVWLNLLFFWVLKFVKWFVKIVSEIGVLIKVKNIFGNLI